MTKISNSYGKILAFLLACLGFSCDRGVEKYGTPTATFKAKGVVVSETDDTPIEGIRAVLKADKWHGMDTVYTDSKGIFNLKSQKGEHDFKTLYVEFSDVDGEKNGAFVDKEVEADYSNENFTDGNKNWYRGEAEKDLGVVKMESKE